MAALSRLLPGPVRAAGRAVLGGGTRAARDLGAFALPQRCPGCGAPADPARLLCTACCAALPAVPFAFCARCLVLGRDPVGCRLHAARAVRAAWVFDERARAFVHAFKFGARPGLAAAAASALAAAAGPRRSDLVLHVPMHPLRERLRGYNQAAELARHAAARLGVPWSEDGLVRRALARRQVGAGARARRRRLARAFEVVRPAELKGRHVLLVDDVITTGATMDACLGALAAAGAQPLGVVLAWAQ